MATTYRNGGTGNDVLDGSATAGPQQVQGRAGDDTITGGSDADKLYGNEGNDILIGGAGADTLSGTTGADIYVINRADLGTGNDVILDFDGAGNGAVAGDDVLHFTGFSAAATFTLVRHSGSDHVYLIEDGGLSSQLTIRYSGTATLTAGDYLFLGTPVSTNAPPVAGADTATVTASGPRTITLSAAALMANDADPEGSPLRITGVGAAAHGTVTFSDNGTAANFADDVITYTPQAGYAGSDSFSYILSDGAASAPGTVNVTVQAVAATPTTVYRNGTTGHDVLDGAAITAPQQVQGRAGDDTITGGSGNDKLYGNEGNDTLSGGAGVDTFSGGAGADTYVLNRADLGAGTETLLDFDGAGDGAASGDVLRLDGFGAGARLNFVRHSGNDHIYEISDAGFTTQLKIVHSGTAVLAAGDYVITPPANHAPVLTTASVATRTNDIVAGKLLASDADADSLTFSLTTGPAHGVLKLGADGGYIYAPTAGFDGADAFTVTIDDGHGGVTQSSVSVTVTASTHDTAPARDAGPADQLVFIQRDGTSGSFYVGGEAKVLKDGTVIAEASGGVILGIPQGEGYILQSTAAGVTTNRPLSVGEVIVAAGQSNMTGWFTDAGNAFAPESGIYVWAPVAGYLTGKWVQATGAGALAFAETLQLAEPGLPVAFVNGAYGGTPVTPVGTKPNWSATEPGSLFQNMLTQTNVATHNTAALVLWNQGEADAVGQVGTETYAAALQALFGRIDAALSPQKIVLSGLAYTIGTSDAIRAGQAQVAAAMAGHVLHVPTTTSIETWDGTHLTNPSRIFQATEAALAWLSSRGIDLSTQVAHLTGTAEADSLTGSGLIDVIQSGAGADSVSGGNGNDILRGEAGADHLRGDGGNDALSGGLDADTVEGGDGNDEVFGDAGNDVLTGGAGNDRLDGGTGADTLYGQGGDDLYLLDSLLDVVDETLAGSDAGGIDAVRALFEYTLGAGVENLIIGTELALNGTGNGLDNTITGNIANNRLWGLGGNDSLFGGAGGDTLDGGDGDDVLTGGDNNDTLIGGNGNDTYNVEKAGDIVVETASGGYDTIISPVTYVLPDHVEAIVLSGKTNAGATGTSADNSLTGNVTANLLDGAGGNDVVIGLAGNDTLTGRDGNDTLDGGEGRDTMTGGAGVDIMTGDFVSRSRDVFVFEALSDLGVGAGNRDIVTDFDCYDVLDLSLIDANIELAGDQSFVFISSGPFTAAGQVRYIVSGSDIIVAVNVDSNLESDAEILLSNAWVIPVSSDFSL